ncbi:MAG: extracellular solute-binding protein [Candidatus Bathyarchaeia archaeon]
MSEEPKKGEEPKKMDRRKFIYAGLGAVAVAAVGAAAYYGTRPPEVITTTQTLAQTVTTMAPPTSSAVQSVANYPFSDLIGRAKEASIDWTQCKGENITMACLDWAGIEDIRLQAAVFNQITGISVLLDRLPEEELRAKLQLDITSGAGVFDCYWLDPMTIATYAKIKGLEPLQQYLDDPTLTDKAWFQYEDMFAPARGMGINPGDKVLYAIPFSAEPCILTYRNDLVQQYNVKVPDTTDDLVEAAKALHHPDKGYAGILLRGQRGNGQNMWVWPGFLDAFGGSIFDENWKPVFNGPEGKAALDLYVNLDTNYGPEGIVNWGAAESQLACNEGKVAMNFDFYGRGLFADDPTLGGNPEVKGLWSFAVPPMGPVKRADNFYAWMYAMSSASKHKKAAWLWLQWAQSREVGLNFQYEQGYGCPRNWIFQNADFKQRWASPQFNNFIDVYTETANKYSNPEFRPRIPEYPEVGDAMSIEIQNAIAKTKDTQKALDDAATAVTAIMSKAGYY